ncbi:MAG: type II toxin-antitoxin system RelB/DinJ family antitoxin [bacterium]
MSKKTRVSARVDEEVKHEVERIFDQMGLSTSSAVSMFLNQVVREQGFPFLPHLIPNNKTRAAMRRSREEEQKVFDNEEELFADLELK